MSKILLESIEVILAVGLLFGIFRYWNSRVRLRHGIETSNKSYGLFLLFQVLTMLFIIVEGTDPQNARYLQSLTMFSDGAYEYWSIVGVELFGFALTYMLANLLGHILFSAGYQAEKGLYELIEEDQWQVVLIACSLIFTFGVLISYFVLRPFLLEWISANAMVPLT